MVYGRKSFWPKNYRVTTVCKLILDMKIPGKNKNDNDVFSVCTAIDIPHGKLSPSTTVRFGDTVSANCNTGYTTVGNNTITCNKDRKFSNVPTCYSG